MRASEADACASRNTEQLSRNSSGLIQAKEHMGREVAEYLLSIDFSREGIDRMNFLAEQAKEGLLSPEEVTELHSYLHVGMTIMQSKREHTLKGPNIAGRDPNNARDCALVSASNRRLGRTLSS